MLFYTKAHMTWSIRKHVSRLSHGQATLMSFLKEGMACLQTVANVSLCWGCSTMELHCTLKTQIRGLCLKKWWSSHRTEVRLPITYLKLAVILLPLLPKCWSWKWASKPSWNLISLPMNTRPLGSCVPVLSVHPVMDSLTHHFWQPGQVAFCYRT